MKPTNFKKIGLIAIWAASLLLVAQWGHTQTPQKNSDGLLGTIISGNDIGFRLEGFSTVRGGGTGVTGTWMVKVDGAWMPATASAAARSITAK